MIILAIAAYITSTISGFLGMAGGVSLLGVMASVLPNALIVPVHGVVQLASNFTRTLVYLKNVKWRIFVYYAIPQVAGVYVATMLWNEDKLTWLKPGIGGVILLFLFFRHFKPAMRNLPVGVYSVLGLFTGFLGIFVGATGPFIAPFFLRDDFKKENTVATKAICQAWTHFLKLPAFLALEFDYSPHYKPLAILIVCVILGTITGKKVLSKLSEKSFKLIFEWVLGGLALFLIFGHFFSG